MISLHNRHLVDRSDIPFDRELWLRTTRETMRRYYPKFIEQKTYQQVIDRYTGGKKKLYMAAKRIIEEEGLSRRHATVKMFVKPDRWPVGVIEEKDPRAIQYRNPVYNLALLKYISPYEDFIYENVKYGVVSNTRVIAKGLNQVQRAELFLEKVSHFKRPRFVCIDHSRFDSCINCEHLKSTHRKYMRAMGTAELRKLLRWQLRNKCYSRGGIKYKTKGTRMSGDPDTGCGNTIVNLDTLWGVLRELGITKYDILVDGDDSVIIVEEHDIGKFNKTVFERFGFNTKLEIVKEIEDVEFCQSKIIRTEPPRFVRKPVRAMSHSMACRNEYKPQQYEEWLAGVGMCEMAMNSGVPVMWEYARQLAATNDKRLLDQDYVWKMGSYACKSDIPVTLEARMSFQKAFGIDICMQLILEMVDYTSNAFSYKNAAKSFQRAWSGLQSLPTSGSGCWWASCGGIGG